LFSPDSAARNSWMKRCAASSPAIWKLMRFGASSPRRRKIFAKTIPRSLGTRAFIHDLYRRTAAHLQSTTDGYYTYQPAVPEAFGLDVDFAQLKNLFGDLWPSTTPLGGTPQAQSSRLYPRSALVIPIPTTFYIVRRAPEPNDADAHA
jgi:hypothetical protein